MAAKLYSVTAPSGISVYVISRRRSDKYLFDADSGTFVLNTLNPFVTLIEDAIIRGLYEHSENRSVWGNCEVTNFYYIQTGVTCNPVDDMIIAVEDWAINNDTANDYTKVIAAALAGKTSGAGTVAITFRDITDTFDAIHAIVDEYGNRVIVNLGGL